MMIFSLAKNARPRTALLECADLSALFRLQNGKAATSRRTRLPMCLLCFGLVAANHREEAEAVRDELLRMAATGYVKEYFIAMAQLALGEHDQSLAAMEKAAVERDPWLVWFGTEPKLDPLRNNPRFIELFRSTNNPMALKARQALSG